jgi:hypothetical protein
MKLRIKGNSLRIRVTKSEVDYFANENYLEEKTEFGNATFVYAMQSSTQAKNISATFIENKITLLLPSAIANEWATTNQVGIEGEIEIGSKKLFLLIEKDFKCLDNVAEDQSDNYENPNAGKIV